MRTDSDLCLVTHPLSGPGEPAALSLATILRDVVNGVTVVTARLPDDSEIRSEFDYVELDAGRSVGDRTIVRDIIEFLRNQLLMCLVIYRSGADSILFFGATSYVVPIAVSRVLGKRTILEPRGDVPLTLRLVWSERTLPVIARFLAGIVWALERIGYRLATDIVLYTPSMQTQLGLEQYDAKTHLHGARYVDTERFQPKRPFETREQRVGYIGRLDEEKGIEELIEAASVLAEEGISFTFVGDGELSDEVESRLSEQIEDGRVDVVGWVDHEEVPAYLNRLQLLVMASSPTEGLPMTILESMACGTPVCAPPVAGIPDVLRDGETGVTLDSLDGETIAERVHEALHDGELARMSDLCVDLIKKEFSFDAAVERYSDIFDATN